MSSVGFFVLPHSSSILASLKLAQDLREAGHRVRYFGIKDCEPCLLENGFEFVPLYEDYFPAGYFSATVENQKQEESIRSKLKVGKHIGDFKRHILAEGDGEFLSKLREYGPDLLVVVNYGNPEIAQWPALMAYSTGLKTVLLSDALCPCESTGMPPHDCAIIPTTHPLSRLKTWLAWRKTHFFHLRLNDWLLGIGAFTRSLMAKYGYHDRLYDYSHEKFSQFKVPELYSFPVELEFPGADTLPDRYYIGPSISLNRSRPSFPWQRIDNRPLIYCAMGNLVFLGKRNYLKFFNALLAAARQKPHWQWVLALGKACEPDELNEIPANATVVKSAPQLDLLQRAALMINHGGANTIKEAAFFGVPLVMIPIGIDHEGNTARAVHHGLGLKGKMSQMNTAYLLDLVETVMNNPYFRLQSSIMRAKLQRAEEEKRGAALIEQFLDA
ncbi:MAG: glycosyltransferase [Methylococcaceae bacterium]|nr:glycosyltransferase [Methylococcaceae bacterium]